ncbi:alpha-L-iduronidase-like isoform X2 [Gigantopelta aegis]|uniref:alpha-L-iduronidase-like isoform X2 n=1 Tax=Gigantopelta aegis TaxID=1735272 RepID=UPI001B88B2FE|nr:alpha-L-iduronidase-like isoform X2 [Gigantopelta aegis]
MRETKFIILCLSCGISFQMLMWNGFVSATSVRHTRNADYYTVHIDSNNISQEFKHFWRSTGFCPPDPHQKAYKFDLSPDMEHNLAYLGSIPHSGMQQVRIHWLLDLVAVSGWNGSRPVYNFSSLDGLLDMLSGNGLQPGFEVMGNPSGIFSDFDNKTQVYMWKDLVKQVAEHYISFLNYYDATSEGLKAANSMLRFGGPADGCTRTEYAEALYKHTVDGINYFTGHKGVRIDFISLHEKGHGHSKVILQEETRAWTNIVKNYPSLAHKPFYNDEADPLVGWSKDEIWRSDSTYAAMVVKVIAQHQNLIIAISNHPIKNYTLLSNDNGFLSYYPHQFTQRTLLARFQMNTTTPPHVQYIRKPVHTVMGLLSKLGEKQLNVKITDVSGKEIKNDSHFGVLATLHEADGYSEADSWQVAILMYNSNDTGSSNNDAYVTLHLSVIPPNITDLIFAAYTVNQDFVNPFNIWVAQGKPMFPTRNQFREMRKQEDPYLVDFHPIKQGEILLQKLSLVEPAVTVVHICAKPKGRPDQVPEITIYNITTGQVLIRWSDKCVHSKCVLRYEVEFSAKSSGGPYKRINDKDSYFPVFVYSPFPEEPPSDARVCGYYRIRAVDYWKTPGDYSIPQAYPDDSFS